MVTLDTYEDFNEEIKACLIKQILYSSHIIVKVFNLKLPIVNN